MRIVTLAAFAHSQSIEELAEIDKKVDFYFSSMSRYPLSDLDEAVMKTVSATGLAVIQHDGYVRDEQLNRLVEILYTNFVDDPVSQIDWACKMCNNELLTAYIKIINEQASSRIKLFILYNLCKLCVARWGFR